MNHGMRTWMCDKNRFLSISTMTEYSPAGTMDILETFSETVDRPQKHDD
jgi:hypothetical protein